MKQIIVGLWAVGVTLGAAYVAATSRMDAPLDDTPRLEGLRYTSLPTLSIPVVEEGRVSGYVVLRLVYTADTAVLNNLASSPDPFLSDEVFRTLYASAETEFGRLKRLDMAAFTEAVRTAVNSRMGDEVIEDLLVDGLNYVDLSDPSAAAAANAIADGAPQDVRQVVPQSATTSSLKPQES